MGLRIRHMGLVFVRVSFSRNLFFLVLRNLVFVSVIGQ